MTINAMYHFKNINEFIKFSNLINQMSWNIEKQLLKNRVDFYSNIDIVSTLRNQFKSKEISIWPLKEEEIITWLDTISIMRRLLLIVFEIGLEIDKLQLFMEYPLLYGNHMRADYLMVYDRLIIVLEFGMFNQDEKRSEERYTKKLQDSINYRQILSNLINKEVKIVNYSMIYRPEFDRFSKTQIDENIVYNNKEILTLSVFINKLMKEQDSLSAIAQLRHIV
jgi:hypothetical protein